MPYPVNYGGVFDLFHKLPALQSLGIAIHLHCFDYGRGEQPALNQYCASVNYYPRERSFKWRSLPHIVASRTNELLMQRLLQDDFPILMEGIHCTALLMDPRFKNRRCFVRLHNVEHAYYHDLYRSSGNLLRKMYYLRESALLKKYEWAVAGKATFFTVTEKDATQYRNMFGCKNAVHLPLFIPDWTVQTQPGIGSYCLYHGDLGVDSNLRVAKWLTKKIFAHIKVPLVIAGLHAPAWLQSLVNKFEHIRLVSDPAEAEMQDLIRDAHINIIPSFSATGIKIKLLNALFNGRHCLVNEATVAGTGLEHFCHIAASADHFRDLIAQLYQQPFREDEHAARKMVLEHMFNNAANAKKMADHIWPATIH